LISFFYFSGITYGETLIVYSDKGFEACRFDVELAVTREEQARGLMFRKTMDDRAGMFFIFKEEELRHFWMRNTLISLDIIFIDSNFLVVDIHKGAKPLDERAISSRRPARYVLEINAGKADKCRIKNGTKTRLLKAPL
jgi:uncharacterized membrane protein (UPF0127 family)